jgi:hypothetical protein
MPRWLTGTLVVVVLSAANGQACNVPVFRYALERWKPSSYQLQVFHRGPLRGVDLQHFRSLEASANIRVTFIDLSGTLTPEQETLWRLRGNEKRLPWVIVQYPEDDEKGLPVWTGSPEQAGLEALLDSPARRRLIDLLAKGESAVWLLLTSGNKKADDDAERLLVRELDRMSREIKPPEQQPDDDLVTALPLRVSFTVLRVEHNNPAEQAFVQMLLQSEEDLNRTRGPIVFPVFGRGRLLIGLQGTPFRPTQIERWASFLCGPCSCQVKELNPGVDLLLKARWEELLDLEEENPSARPATHVPAIPPGSKTRPTETGERTGSNQILWLVAGVAGLVLLLAGGWAMRRSAEPQTGVH